jgi:ABC-type nickel/cobalt efflux system permease component RcnA
VAAPVLLVVWSGLTAGAVHVITGADHLAALLPLAVGRRFRAVGLGVRWGLGHSAGVLLIGALGVALREQFDLAAASAWSERLVGVMLVAIGGLGIRHALRLEIHAHAHAHGDGDVESETAGDRAHVHLHLHGPEARRAPGDHAAESGLHDHRHTAFFAGTLHGVAGTAHILGVLPAVAMPSAWASGVYLLAFAAGTVAAMGAFTGLVGEGSARVSTGTPLLLKRLMLSAGALTVLVGVAWIAIPIFGGHPLEIG